MRIGLHRNAIEWLIEHQLRVNSIEAVMDDETLKKRWPGVDLQTAKFLERNFGGDQNKQEQALAGQPKVSPSRFRGRKTTQSTFKKVASPDDVGSSSNASVEEGCHVCGGSGRHNYESGDVRCTHCHGKGVLKSRQY